MASRLRTSLRSQYGFTMPEMLVATAMSLTIVAAGVALLGSNGRAEPQLRSRAAQIQQARTATDRLTRELRQASNATITGGSQLLVLTYVPGSPCGVTTPGAPYKCDVLYTCSTGGTCTRTECTPANPPTDCGTPAQIVSGLATNQVFTFSPKSPGQSYVGVRFEFPAADGEDAITIEDGVALRNPPLGSS
jgi:prepilin-type N-terminal cleavage/methylation domain-containing protein